MKKLTIKNLLLLTVTSVFSFNAQSNYCAAIRGNGQLMPAHWGSLAKITEKAGLPSAMAGGSSASITMFLTESIAMNPLSDTNLKKSLLIKSFEGYVEALTQTDDGKAIMALMANQDELKQLLGKLNKLEEVYVQVAQNKQLLEAVSQILNSSDLKAIINPEFIHYIGKTQKIMEMGQKTSNPGLTATANYRSNEIKNAIKNFGKFSAQSDLTLFFRPGIISFEKFSELIGRMANFYALYGLEDTNPLKRISTKLLGDFLNECSESSKGLTWQEIVKVKPTCQLSFTKAALAYRSELKKQEGVGTLLKSREFDQIGARIPSFPTTSVIIKQGVERFNVAAKSYELNSEKSFGSEFKIHHTQYRFGYWGKSTDLEKIQNNLKSSSGYIDGKGKHQNLSKDKKSQKFLSLGEASWKSALSTSPAEPGLAKILPVKSHQLIEGKMVSIVDTTVLSAGGWDDLHPTLVLNAYGCENIVYITRRGGDSMFGQGVVKKLTKIGGFNWEEWNKLSKEEKRVKNAEGDPDDIGEGASAWSKLYNLANPESSFSKSLKLADAVWCTNWDEKEITDGVHSLVQEGFNAPLLDKSGMFSNVEAASRLGSQDSGNLDFAGCISK